MTAKEIEKILLADGWYHQEHQRFPQAVQTPDKARKGHDPTTQGRPRYRNRQIHTGASGAEINPRTPIIIDRRLYHETCLSRHFSSL